MVDDTEHFHVEVQPDFVDKQTRAKPIPALSELIWNGLDADATRISVELEYGDLAGGLSKIMVHDNGRGFPRSDAKGLFKNLGGSWKRLTRQTPSGRQIHGQEGKGRYKAFALGRSVTWHVSHDDAGVVSSFEVSLLSNNLTDVAVSPQRPSETPATGVTVEVRDVHHDFRVFETEEGLQDMAETFALYLSNYPNVQIEVAGRRVDPATAMVGEPVTIELDPIVTSDGSHAASLQIIEWKSATKRTLYLCSADGFPLDTAETRFHVPGFAFSAYLRSDYIGRLQEKGLLGLAELDAQLAEAVDHSREAIKRYFRERAAEEAKSIVDEWKAEEVYPFKGEPVTTVEKAERQVFEIVAAQVQRIAPEIGGGSKKGKALHLRMLRNALERGPEELQIILREVLDLPVNKQKELVALLQETTLSAIITAAKTVADRLKFIDALESIVFDPETKGRLKERTQLHRILAENTWVFGEEYHLWVSDKGLKKVLEKHRDHLDPSISIEEPVKVYGQQTAIVDLMFSRTSRRHRADDIEHLIVELKAPKVKIGADEIVQTKKYQLAVTSDERFQTVAGVRWHFIVVSNALDDYARGEIEGGPDKDRRLISRNARSTVAIKTWGEIIEENRARLQFFQQRLEHSASEGEALKYLHEKHAALLKGVVDESDWVAEEAPGEA
jgi:hypothetical protein